MVQLSFGVGTLWGERSDVPTGPTQFAILQEVNLEFSWEIRELYSQYQFPVDIARGKGKITGKAKYARILGSIYSDLFFGITSTAGQNVIANNEVASVPATPGPYTVTVANAANFRDDLGVYFSDTARRIDLVASGPVAGQYSVNESTGVYTFAAADQGRPLYVSYRYSVTTGRTITLSNQFLGFTPTFKATFHSVRSGIVAGGQLVVVLNACTSNRLSIPNTMDDYALNEFEFSAFADVTGSMGTIMTAE